MILVDTGPLVALFDPRDADHAGCAAALAAIAEPLCTTVPVLTEAFHLLAPGSIGARRLMDFVSAQGLGVWFLDDAALGRAFELMVQYADRPMDLADASLVVLAETLVQRRIFTLDRGDFAVYRIKRGHQTLAFDVLDPGG
ncbi:PIN domain-containing protein [uncultured Thiohalocapsa sp.]|uniref:type II toxin-antitoxin system VapC family toxin n=1 Tax=uncultured Thiohalocapsa sp. TaxID=768990 RepID=UPI0025EA53A3|nr:PIN domain-containing protein [uncultured Thiohalocapsa sp.]